MEKRIVSLWLSRLALRRSRDLSSASSACLRSVTSEMMPMSPMILPSGSQIASARSWAEKTRPLLVTMSSSPAQDLPLSIVSNNSLATAGSLTTTGPPPAASNSSAVSYPNSADKAWFWKM
jgi:hypothetical protein